MEEVQRLAYIQKAFASFWFGLISDRTYLLTGG